MAKILFLAHRVPYPPNKGDKIRTFNLLRHLAKSHDVWLGAGADDLADLKHLPAAKAAFRDAYFAPLGRIRRALNMLLGGLRGAPLSVARFRHPKLDRWIGDVLREVRPDVVVVCSSALAQYVVGRLPAGARLIVDFVDADAEKWRAYAEAARPPMRQVFQAEARRLVAFERRALDAAQAGVLISSTERDVFARLQPEGAGKLAVIANGVDTDFFQPSGEASDGRSIVMCGRMDYLPNIDAACWFAREIFPLVRMTVPDAVFRVVGAAPRPAVEALAALPGVEVTGSVDDVRPYLAAAQVVVAPLRIARGIQNKVLEAFAAGRPVITTPQALEGIDAKIGGDVLVAEDAEAFAEAVCSVLLGRAPKGLGASGRSYAVRRHGWAEQFAALDALIEPKGLSEAAA